MKIDIIEGCFGPDVRIDEESLFQHEYDKRSDGDIRELRVKLIDEISSIIDNLDMNDLSQIADIVVSRSNYEYLESQSHEGTCDQCDNYNYKRSYKKKID